MSVIQLAALTSVAAVLSLSLKKEQPAYAFVVSVCGAVGLAVFLLQQLVPVVTWLQSLEDILPGQGILCLIRVLGIALVSQMAADFSREAGMAATATVAELCGRLLALLQALPLLQELLGSFAAYLQ